MPLRGYPVIAGEKSANWMLRVRHSSLSALASAVRPTQWTKNAIVFAAVVFGGRLGEPTTLAMVMAAAGCFCLASSTVYLINDIQDIAADRQHPHKRFRPIASGRVSVPLAWMTAAMLLVGSLPVAFLLRPAFGAVILAYLVLMAGYSFVLKKYVIIDVFVIAMGFVLRAAGGAIVIDVPISPWLYVCTILLSLFIGFGKRRNELVVLGNASGSHRRNLEDYSIEMLDQLIVITAAATIMAYSLYTFAAPSLPGNHMMMVTIPFVLYAVFRYLFLVQHRNAGGSPEKVLFNDSPLLSSIALWGAACVAILYML
jgi:4-hydroxybenzoate polyprenyltransferase